MATGDFQDAVAASATGTATLMMGREQHVMTAGNEGSGKTKKVFIFSGNSPIQVIDDDGTTRSDIETPATDWTGSNHPFFGIMHRNRVWAFGNNNFPHTIYTSLPGDHEDFASGGALSNFVFPEDGDRLNGAFVFKGRLFVSKFPRGVYILEDSDADDTKWFFRKLNSDFGFGSAHSVAAGLDEVFALNTVNSITQVGATDNFGDIESADLLRNMGVEGEIRERMVKDSYLKAWAMYHQEEKKFYYTYRTTESSVNNIIMVLDFSVGNPRVSFMDKDDPVCLGLLRLDGLSETPAYGSNDGYVMKLNDPDRRVNKASGVAYEGIFQTPHTDFGDPGNKNFDFLELSFEPTGQWDVDVDVIIDGVYKETVSFEVSAGAVLDDFELDTDFLASKATRNIRKQIHGHGRTISYVVKNSGLDENFKLNKMVTYFRRAGQGQKDGDN